MDLLTAARLVLESSGDDLVDALAWLDDAVHEEETMAKTLRVSVTFEADEHDRRAIACMSNRHGRLASADELRSHFRVYGVASGGDDNHWEAYERCEQCHPELRERGA